MFLSAILPYYNGILLMLMLLKNKVSPLLDKWGYCLNKRYKTFFKKHLTNVSICDKILWYCGATGYTVRLGQSEPCKIYQTLCGYGGIGRRVWFRSICSQGHAGSSPVIRTSGESPQTSSRLTLSGALFFIRVPYRI